MDSAGIRRITGTEATRAVATQVVAFASDPTMRWLYPEPFDYIRHFPNFARAFGGGAIECETAYAKEGFGGVAMWLPVDVHPDGEAIESIFRETLAEPLLSEALAVLEQMDGFHTQEPHWYLTIIGVDPAHQGRGIGSELLRHSLTSCDEKGLIAYLESSNPANLPLYQRHGFEVLGEIQVGSSPVITPMIRHPR